MTEKRVAIVTGGSRGIGASHRQQLAKAGYNVVARRVGWISSTPSSMK